jgi:hypothetical protein
MSVAQDLERAGVLARPVPTVLAWDAAAEEPNLDIYMRCRRTVDDAGQPCSRWEFAMVLADAPDQAPTQVQRDYAATLMRHGAMVIQDVNLEDHVALGSNLARLAGMLRAELKATMTTYRELGRYIADHNAGRPVLMAPRLMKQIRHRVMTTRRLSR